MNLNFIAFLSCLTAAVYSLICPIPFCPLCPLCPVIAGAAAQGTLSAGNALLTASIAATASVPFVLAFVDNFRTRNISFDFPSSRTIYHVNETYPLFMHTFGLASRMHLRTADLYLLNSTFDRVLKIASEKEFKVLQNVERSKWGVPEKGVGHLDFTLPPSLSSGIYYIKYVSGWTVWRHQGEFEAVTDGFVIAGSSDASCDTIDCIQGLNTSSIRQPSSFTAKDAPSELQFMFSHTELKEVPQKFLNGVIDGVAAIPKAIVNPNINTIKHPIEAMKNLSRDWEEKEEKDPYTANGQAFGVGLAVGIPSQLLVKKLMEKKVSPNVDGTAHACTGPNCGHNHGETQAAGVAACTGPNCGHSHDHPHDEIEPAVAACTGPNCGHSHDHPHEEIEPAPCTGPNCAHHAHDAHHGHEAPEAPPAEAPHAVEPVQVPAVAPVACTGLNCPPRRRQHTCTGPNCGHGHNREYQPASAFLQEQATAADPRHEFQVMDGSMDDIKSFLVPHGTGVSEISDGASIRVRLDNPTLEAAQLVEMLQKQIGAIVRHV